MESVPSTILLNFSYFIFSTFNFRKLHNLSSVSYFLCIIVVTSVRVAHFRKKSDSTDKRNATQATEMCSQLVRPIKNCQRPVHPDYT